MPEQDTLVSKNQFLLRYEQGFACPLVSPAELTVIALAGANTAILPVSLYPLIS